MIPFETLSIAQDHQQELRAEASDAETPLLTQPAPVVGAGLRHGVAGALRGLAERLEPEVYRTTQ
jgi:hypothetical protein